MNISKDEKIIERILNKGVEQILPSKQMLSELLLSGKRLNIYQGFDPTAPSLHIGHTVGMRKLEDFRKLGHQIFFVIGDFTARVGDPSDKGEARDSARKVLSKKEVEGNMKKYVEQASSIIDIFNRENPVKVVYNSQWLEPLTFEKIIDLASEFTVQQLLKRHMFQERIKEDKPIYLNEFLYPLMQGYDSVMMDIDIEIGGNDQLFNMLAGRDLIKSRLNKEKVVITNKLLSAIDGTKMGKSEDNMISLDDSSNDIYGKVMAFTDEQILIGFEILTNFDLEEIAQIESRLNSNENPINIKKELAYEITKDIKGEEEAKKAQTYFENIFQRLDTEVEIPTREIGKDRINIIDLLLFLDIAKSKSEARRLVEQEAVKINDRKILDWKEEIDISSTEEYILKCGKHIYQIK
ncbi:MAG: tyrosine--tRNA ligase [Candidatus Dojkabacteria bacterium]